MSYAYYIKTNGEEQGPYTFNELIRLHLAIDTRVLSPMASNWEDACNVPELYSYFVSLGIYFPAKSNLASFWWRLLAYTIDAVLIEVGALFIMNKLALSGVINSHSPGDMALAIIVFHLILILYNSIFEATAMKGSPGKRICRLAVVDVDGFGIGFLRALRRNLYKILSRVVFYWGFLRVLWDDHRQGWHDEFAKTYVVSRSKSAANAKTTYPSSPASPQ